MKFETLKRRVERGEALVEGRMAQTRVRASAAKSEWRDAWTPMRIIAVGLAAGFAVGHVKPEEAMRKLGGISGSGWLGTLSTVSRLVMVVQSTIAAFTAKDAADTAEAATGKAQAAVDAAQEGVGNGKPAPTATPAATDTRDRTSDGFPNDDSLRY